MKMGSPDFDYYLKEVEGEVIFTIRNHRKIFRES